VAYSVAVAFGIFQYFSYEMEQPLGGIGADFNKYMDNFWREKVVTQRRREIRK
jgi:hypothetical protein